MTCYILDFHIMSAYSFDKNFQAKRFHNFSKEHCKVAKSRDQRKQNPISFFLQVPTHEAVEFFLQEI